SSHPLRDMTLFLSFAVLLFFSYTATTLIYTLSLHDALPISSIKLIQASAVLDLTEDDFDFLTSNKVWIATDRSRARRCVEHESRSEERFSRNAETDLVCRLLLEKKKKEKTTEAVKGDSRNR